MPAEDVDPIDEPVPDYASEAFAADRQQLIASGLSEQQAIQALTNMWNRQAQVLHDRRLERNQAERQAQEERDRLAREEQEHQAALLATTIEADRREADKKKTRAGHFDPDRMVASSNEPRPSPYTVEKLQKKEYVELWYFTREGCLDADRQRYTTPNDIMSLSRDGDGVQLRSISSTRASKNVVQDRALTWDQIMIASKVLIKTMLKNGWPREHIDALTVFFLELNYARAQQDKDFDQVVIEYQHLVRFQWHSSLGTDEAFNIARINHDRINHIRSDLTFRNHN